MVIAEDKSCQTCHFQTRDRIGMRMIAGVGCCPSIAIVSINRRWPFVPSPSASKQRQRKIARQSTVMSVRTTERIGPANSRRRNNTYTFGDLLSQYTSQLQSTQATELGVLTCPDLAAGSIKGFNAATNKE
jgi:hypothetical protein